MMLGESGGDVRDVKQIAQCFDQYIDGMVWIIVASLECGDIDEFGVDCSGFIELAVEANHVREHDADGYSMDHIEVGCQGVRCGMGGTQHTVFDGHSGVGRPKKHLTPGLHIAGILQNFPQTRDGDLKGPLSIHQ